MRAVRKHANRFLCYRPNAGAPSILGYIWRSNKRASLPMPELPEVETTRRGIAPYVEGQNVTAVRLYDRRLRWPVPEDLAQRLVGRVVEKVERRSKYLLFRLGMDTLLIHLVCRLLLEKKKTTTHAPNTAATQC